MNNDLPFFSTSLARVKPRPLTLLYRAIYLDILRLRNVIKGLGKISCFNPYNEETRS